MLPANQFNVLQRVAALHHRSLPVYLTYAPPWVPPNHEDRRQVIDEIAADHHELVERIVRILEAEGRPFSLGDFPMAYTDLNDLSLDFILTELVRYEERLQATLLTYREDLPADGIPGGIVDDAVRMASAHREILKNSPGDSPAMRP